MAAQDQAIAVGLNDNALAVDESTAASNGDATTQEVQQGGIAANGGDAADNSDQGNTNEFLSRNDVAVDIDNSDNSSGRNDNRDQSDSRDQSIADSRDQSDNRDQSSGRNTDNSNQGNTANSGNTAMSYNANQSYNTTDIDNSIDVQIGDVAVNASALQGNVSGNTVDFTPMGGTTTEAGPGRAANGSQAYVSYGADNTIRGSFNGFAGQNLAVQNTGANSLTQQQVSFQGNINANQGGQ